MDNNPGQPSPWLMKNSDGKPDFLFTILTYAFILLTFISLMWIAFGCLGVINASIEPQCSNILKIMSDMKTGLVSLAGLVFGLAGSYTVRRFKKDKLELEKGLASGPEETETEEPESGVQPVQTQELSFVSDSEDI